MRMLSLLIKYVLGMEEGQMQCKMPALRPFDLLEYGGIVRRHVPSRSIVGILKYSVEDKENIMECLELWNSAIMASGWSIDVKMVMFPLYGDGHALQYFRTLPTEVKENFCEIKQEFQKYFNSPSQRLQTKNLLGERSQKLNESVAEYYENIYSLVQRARGSRTIEFQREKSLEYFIKGLMPTDKKMFWGEVPEDLDIAYEKPAPENYI